MIVTLAAWLYVVQALIGLGAVFAVAFGLGSGMEAVVGLMVAALFGVLAYGLFAREAWGRWLALGLSAITWTFGSLMLINVFVTVAATGGFGIALRDLLGGGANSIIVVLLALFFLYLVASAIVAFRLFLYLCSEEGCGQFGVPQGSTRAVVTSIAAWIAIGALQGALLDGSGPRGGQEQARARSPHGGAERATSPDPLQMKVDAERREAERELDDERRHAEQDARLRAMRDVGLDRESAPRAPGRARVPVAAPDSPPQGLREEGSPDANRILKCRDASGAVTFTQGYCPPGSQRVDMNDTR